MALYALLMPGGVQNTATLAVLFPGDPDWLVYEDWLAAGNVPDPYSPLVPTLLEERTEARARLAVALYDECQAILGLGVSAAGSRWNLGPVATAVYLVQRARSNPFGTLRLPDVDGVYRNVTSNQLNDIIDAVANYQRALLTWAEAKRTSIDASGAPLTIPLNDFPPPP